MQSFSHAEAEPETARTRSVAGSRDDSALMLRAAVAGRTDVLGAAGLLRLQRAVGNAATAELVEESRSPVLDVISSGGTALEPDVRGDMEARLGADFSDVRIHTDDAAHQSAQAVSAYAYTVGSDIAFQRDAYDPGSAAGQKTLAHELTHVIQQRSGPVDGTPTGNGVSVSDPSDSFEREAASNAERVLANGYTFGSGTLPEPETVTSGSDGIVQRTVVQRDDDDDPDSSASNAPGSNGAAGADPEASDAPDPALVAAGAELQTLSDADPDEITSGPEAAVQWLDQMTAAADALQSAGSTLPSAGADSGTGGPNSASVQADHDDQCSAPTQRGAPVISNALVIQRDPTGTGPTPSDVGTDLTDLLTVEKLAPPPPRPGHFDKEYDAYKSAYNDAKKGEIDANAACKKAKNVAVGALTTTGFGALFNKTGSMPVVPPGGTRSVAGPLATAAAIAASITVLNSLIDARASVQKWQVSLDVLNAAKKKYDDLIAGEDSEPAIYFKPFHRPDADADADN